MKDKTLILTGLTTAYLTTFIGSPFVFIALPLICEDIGLTATLTGLVIGSFGIAKLIFDVPAGYIIDRYGKKKTLLIGSAVVALAYLSFGVLLMNSIPLELTIMYLLMTRILDALGSSFIFVSSPSIIGSLTPSEKRGMTYSLTTILPGLGGFAGMSLAGLSASVLGPYLTILIYGALFTLIFVIYVVTVSERIVPKVEEKVTWNDISKLAQDKRILTIAYLNFAWSLPRVAFFFIIPYVAVKNYGLLPTVASSFAGLPMLVSSPMGVFGGWVCDRYGRKPVVLVSTMILALSTVLLSFPGSLMLFLLACLLAGLGGFGGAALTAYLTDIAPAAAYGRTFALTTITFDLSWALGPALGYYLLGSYGQPSLFATMSVLLGAGVLVFMRTCEKAIRCDLGSDQSPYT